MTTHLKHDQLFAILASRDMKRGTTLLTFNMGAGSDASNFSGFTEGAFFSLGETATSCASKLRELAGRIEKTAAVGEAA
jgi:hypothetical protein